MTSDELYKCQDQVISKISAFANTIDDSDFLILAGGTALSRYCLNHRVSYDLDYFVNHDFSPDWMFSHLRKHGLHFTETARENRAAFATQLIGVCRLDNEEIKVSFVEDVFSGMFDACEINNVHTETIEGLYHRKLRTITGTGETVSYIVGKRNAGGRQKARDLFDLLVLHDVVQPINGGAGVLGSIRVKPQRQN